MTQSLLNTQQVPTFSQAPSLSPRFSREEYLLLLQELQDDSEKRLQSLIQENKLLQEENSRLHSLQEDAAAHLQVSQYQLAKKAKETHELIEKVQTLEMQLTLLNNSLINSERKIENLQLLLKGQELQIQQLQKDCQQSRENAELYLKELQKKEATSQELQQLWVQLGSLINNPPHSNPPIEKSPLELKSPKLSLELIDPAPSSLTTPAPFPIEKKCKADNQISRPIKKPYQNLFSLPIRDLPLD